MYVKLGQCEFWSYPLILEYSNADNLKEYEALNKIYKSQLM